MTKLTGRYEIESRRYKLSNGMYAVRLQHGAFHIFDCGDAADWDRGDQGIEFRTLTEAREWAAK